MLGSGSGRVSAVRGCRKSRGRGAVREGISKSAKGYLFVIGVAVSIESESESGGFGGCFGGGGGALGGSKMGGEVRSQDLKRRVVSSRRKNIPITQAMMRWLSWIFSAQEALSRQPLSMPVKTL